MSHTPSHPQGAGGVVLAPRRRLAFRCEGGLAAWAEEYAFERGVVVSDLLEAALREFRALAQVGVPEIPVRGRVAAKQASKAASARRGRVRAAAPGISSRPAVPAPVDSVPPAPDAALVPVWRIVLMRMGGLDEARARRHVAFRGVLVDGVPCRLPDRLVEPGRVRV